MVCHSGILRPHPPVELLSSMICAARKRETNARWNPSIDPPTTCNQWVELVVMVSSLRLPQAVQIAHRIRREAPHHIGLALYVNRNGDGWALAVVDTATGDVLAWDGWYFDSLDGVQRTPLATLDFDDFDDMPSKLLAESNGAWLGGPLIHLLIPTYSLADLAGRVTFSHADSAEDADSQRRFLDGNLVAYFPVVEENAFVNRIEQHAQASRYGKARANALLERVREIIGKAK